VLQPGGRRAAEHEDDRGHDRPGRMPAPAAEQGDEGQRSGKQVGEDHRVEHLHGGFVHEPPEEQHGGREQQRLRIGNGGMAAEMIGIPERKLAMFERGAQIAQHRVEVVLRIPRHHHAGQRPGGGGRDPDHQDGRERKTRLVPGPRRRALADAKGRML
jgi:hypothetical protein